MELLERSLSPQEINKLKKLFGEYFKLTGDIGKEIIVAGCELHADGEQLLLDNGSKQADIWGGGINLKTKEIDCSAVLNLRPNLGNNSLEIIDSKRREKFIKLVGRIFRVLWQN